MSWKNEAGRLADDESHGRSWNSIVASGKPLIVMIVSPFFAFTFWMAGQHFGGSYLDLLGVIFQGKRNLMELVPSASEAMSQWQLLCGFVLFEVACILWLPGRTFQGPVTPSGGRVLYTHNGTLCLAVSLATYLLLGVTGLYDYGSCYRRMGAMLVFLNVAAAVVCVLLYLKGGRGSEIAGSEKPAATTTTCVDSAQHAHTSRDVDRSGNILLDFYWGTELHPRIGQRFDIKSFVVTRWGMIGWALLILDFAAEQYRSTGQLTDSMVVSVFLQMVYIVKFFLWETGYYCSMDIQHDRAGYYLIWGCMVWLPAVYTTPTYFLTARNITLGPILSAVYVLAGLACIFINWDADRQRVTFRATQGNSMVWGRRPSVVRAEYTTDDGQTKSALLLASGYWGISRHFHYLPEILAALFWTLPAGTSHVLPFAYVIYLTCLLLDRAYRDDARCSNKYGKYWKQYCQKVPFRIIPYLF